MSFDQSSNEFRVKALEAYGAGEEVFITYGPKSNAELLVSYGFVLPGLNPYDSVCIKIGFDAHDPLAMQKRMMMPRGLTLLGEESWELALRWKGEGAEDGKEDGKCRVEFASDLMMLLRLCACEGEDFIKMPLLFQNMVGRAHAAHTISTLGGLRGCSAGRAQGASRAQSDLFSLLRHLLRQALSEANERKALSLLVRAARQAIGWTEGAGGGELAAAVTAGEGEGTGNGWDADRLQRLQRLRASDKLLLEAAIEQAEFLQTQPLPDGGAAAQGGEGGFDDDEAW